jgi:hypothetical protein
MIRKRVRFTWDRNSTCEAYGVMRKRPGGSPARAARFAFHAIRFAFCLLFAGCSTAKHTQGKSEFDLLQATRFWQPHLLYLLATPHARLYVEVDAVEGCEPRPARLDELRNFLAAYCAKPGGIEIVRGDVIPIKDAKGVARKTLARRFLDGPPPGNPGEPSPAFMYVLYYDGKWCDARSVDGAGTSGTNSPPRARERKSNPHVDFLPYPAAMFINTRYGPKLIHDKIASHEAGHLLGLAGRTTTATNYHCVNKTCLMYPTINIHISRLLTFRDPITQKSPCQQCTAQLSENASQSTPPNLRFIGPVLVRSEAGYHVLNLPDRVKLLIGDLTEPDCREFANAVRDESLLAEANNNGLKYYAVVKEELHNEVAKVHDILNRAKNDPYEGVREAATRLLEVIPTR